MENPAITIRALGKSFKLTPAQIGKRYKKRRVLTEDLSQIINRGQKRINTSTFWALRDISFEIQKGEVLGIMGPNGAGKTTLLKVLSKITYPTIGEVEIWGRTGALLEVGTGFHSELTGRENIFLSGSIMGMSGAEIENKFDEIVSFSGIEEFLDVPVKRYSSGMEMRLAFSVAAHLEAEILFIDEVLAVGDAAFRNKCIAKIEEITGQGRTILFVSHNLKAIRDLCSKAIVMDGGRLVMPPSPVAEGLETYYKIVTQRVGHSLADRQDRSGLGGLRLLEFSIHDDHGKVINQTKPGRPFELKIKFKNMIKGDQKLSAIIDLVQPDGQPLATLESGEFYTADEKRAEGSLSCFVQNLPITPGVVQINLKLQSDGQIQDKVTHAAYMIIGDESASSGPVNGSFPVVKIDQKWELQ